LHRGSPELVTPNCRLRSTTPPSDSPRQTHNRITTCGLHRPTLSTRRGQTLEENPGRHAILTPPPSRGPWSVCIRAVPSAAFSSTASNIHHARPSCTQLGRGLSSPSGNTAMRCTSLLRMSLLCSSMLCIAPPPSSVAGPALHSGLTASQVPSRLSLPWYCRARPRCPSCGSVPSRHASPPSTHARTARVLGPHRAAAHASESALRATARSGPFASARVPLLRSHAYTAFPRCCSTVHALFHRARGAPPARTCLRAPAPHTCQSSFCIASSGAHSGRHSHALSFLARLLRPRQHRAPTEPPAVHACLGAASPRASLPRSPARLAWPPLARALRRASAWAAPPPAS
jgi:hypothetical protein